MTYIIIIWSFFLLWLICGTVFYQFIKVIGG
jgi:hypothetical protein